MTMHPRVSLHQVAFMADTTAAFARTCRAIGVRNMTLVTPLLKTPGGMDEAMAAAAGGDLRATTLNHVFAPFPDLERDDGRAADGLIEAIDMAATIGADSIYLLTGGRGGLDWEGAAARFAELIAPCRATAEARSITLLAENANLFNADIHIAHTLADAIRLAEIAGIGLCLDLHSCWFEGDLLPRIRRAVPFTGLVQISDYVLGDRSTPCRAVPGDGIIPHERLIGAILDAGYAGLFDLELVGPRIQAEGAQAASARSAEYLSEILIRLGA
jgi:sugar phosphate isomerase/epimerase